MAEQDPNEWVWVRDTTTRHQYPVRRVSLDDSLEVLEGKPAVDASGAPLPAKPHVPAARKAAASSRPSTSETTKE